MRSMDSSLEGSGRITVFLADDNVIVRKGVRALLAAEPDLEIVEALVHPVAGIGGLTADEENLLQQVAEGRPIKAIAVAQHTTPAAIAEAVDRLFMALSREASTGEAGSLRRLRSLHQAIVDREEQGETLSRLLPTGLAAKVRNEGRAIGETEELVVTVIMSDIRGYSGIAETS